MNELKIRFARSQGYRNILSIRLKDIILDQDEFNDLRRYTIPYSKDELFRLGFLEEIYLWWKDDKYFNSVEEICDIESDDWEEFKEYYGGE